MAKIRTFNIDELASLKSDDGGNLLVSSGLQDSQRFAYTPDFNAESFTERNIPLEFQNYGIMQEARAQRQSAIDQIANGIGKMGILAGTTFADGTLGTIIGALNVGTQGVKRYAEGDPTGEGFEFSDFWNNPVSQSLQDLNAASEEWMPNYRTRAEEDSFWLKRAFGDGAANFWGDTFLKNLGFTIGALGSAAFTMGVGAELTGISATAKALRQGLSPQNKVLMKELAKATGKNSFKNTDEIVEALLKTDVKSAGPLLKELQTSAKALSKLEARQMLGGSLLAAQGEARIEAIHGAKEYEEKRVKELMQQGYSEEEAEIQAQQDSLSVGNLTFALNMPILTFSNFVQFSKMFKGGYNPNKITARISGNIDDVLRGKGVAGVTKVGKLETAGRILKPAFTEGVIEEMGQGFASEFAGNYISRRNDNSEQNAFISSVTDGFMDTYGNADRWEEGFVGGLTGLLGMPNFGKLTSKTKRADKGVDWWAGGISDEISQIRKINDKSKKVADTINSLPSSIGKLYTDNNVQASIDKDKVNAAINNDEKTYRTLENEGLTHHVSTMIDAGKYNDLVDFLDSFNQMDAAEIRSMMMGKNDKNEPIDPYQNFTDEQLKQYMVSRANKIKANAQSINQLKESVETKFSGLSEDAQMEILRYASNINNIEERIGELFNIYQTYSFTGVEADKAFKAANIDEFKEQIEEIYKKNFSNLDSKEFQQNVKATIADLKKSVKKGLTPMQNEELNKQITDLVQLAFDRAKFISLYDKATTKPEQFQELIDKENEAVEKAQTDKTKNKEEAVTNLSKKITDAGYNIKLNDNLVETELDKTEGKRNTATGVPVFYKGKLGFLRRIVDKDNKTKLQIVSPDGTTLLASAETDESFINLERNTIVISLGEYRKYVYGIKQANLKEAQLKGLQRLVQEYSDKLTFYNPEQLDKAKQKREELYQELGKLKNLKPNSVMSEKDIDEEIWLVKELIKEVENEIYKLEQAKLDLENSWLYLSEVLEEIKALPEDVYVPVKDIISSLNQALWERQEQIKQDFNEVVQLEQLQEETTNQLDSINNQLDALYKERIDLLDLLNAFEEIHDNNKGYSNLLRVLPESAEFRAKYPDSLRFFKPGEIKYVIDRKDPKVYKKFRAYVKFEAAKRGMSQRDFLKQFNEDLKNTNKALLTAVEEQTHQDFWFITDDAIRDITAKINSLEKLAKELAQKQMNIEDKIITKLSDVSAGQTIAKKLFDNARYLQENYKALYNRSSNIYQAIRRQQAEQYKEIVQDQAEQPDENTTLEEFTQQNYVTDIIFGTTGNDTEYVKEGNKKNTVYDESGKPVLNPNPDMQRWMKWINTIGPNNIMEKNTPLYKAKYVNAKELSSMLGRPVLDRDNNEITGEDDLFVVILDKDGNLVKYDKEIVFTALFKPETITKEIDSRLNINKIKQEYLNERLKQGNLKTETIDGKKLYTITEGGVAEEVTDEELDNRIKQLIKQQYTQFINEIIRNKGKNITSPIIGITNGIPLHTKDKGKTPVTKLGFKLGINAKVLVSTKYSKDIVPGQEFRPGTILIQDNKTGAYIPAQTRNLLDNINGTDEIETVLQLLNLANTGQPLNTIKLDFGKKDNKALFIYYNGKKIESAKVFPSKGNTEPSLLELILNYGVNDIKQAQNNNLRNQEIFINLVDKSVKFMFNGQAYTLPLADVLNEEKNGDLKTFLAQKRTNLNNKMLLNNKGYYFHPVWNKGTKSFTFREFKAENDQTGYEKYLETILQTTALQQSNRLSNKKLKLSNGSTMPVITEEKVVAAAVTPEEAKELVPYDEIMKLPDGNYSIKTKKDLTIVFQIKDKTFTIDKIIKPDGTEFEQAAIDATNNKFKAADVNKQLETEDGKIIESKKEMLSGFLIPTLRELKPAQGERGVQTTLSPAEVFESKEPSLPVSDVKAKKADIERRRQEELDTAIIKNAEKVGGSSFPTKEVNRINAKYDAELAALEGKPSDSKTTKDEIEDFALVEVGVLKTIKDYMKAGIIKQEC